MIIITLYSISILLIYLLANKEYKRKHNKIDNLSWKYVVIFTLLLVGVNYLYTYSPEFNMTGDRRNYQYGYEYDITPSLGLEYIFILAKHYLKLDFKELALLITGLSIPLVFIAYKYAKGAKPLMLGLFLLTPYVINGFDNFKQTFTNGLACLLFACLTIQHSLFIDCFCIILILLSCTFHPTGFILIPFYLLYRFNLRIKNIFLLLFIVCVGAIFMQPILMLIASITSGIPFLSSKIIQYFAEDSDMGEGRIMISIKGIVYLYIAAVIIKNRIILESKLEGYAYYIIICVFTFLLYLLSYYNVWMPRMAELFYFPVLFFWTKCLDYLPNKNRNIYISILLIGFFTYRLMWLCYVSPITQ